MVIHAIEESTFRAVLKLERADGASFELDARPSDAIALALRTGSGIWMLEEVVADASIPVDAEADAEDQEDFRRFLLDLVRPRIVERRHPCARLSVYDEEALSRELLNRLRYVRVREVGGHLLGDVRADLHGVGVRAGA